MLTKPDQLQGVLLNLQLNSASTEPRECQLGVQHLNEAIQSWGQSVKYLNEIALECYLILFNVDRAGGASHQVPCRDGVDSPEYTGQSATDHQRHHWPQCFP